MTGSAVDSDQWIRRYHPAPAGDGTLPRLVCFPHAGGAATYFHEFSRRLQGTVDVLAVQYPGRQDRRTEPLPASLGELAERIATVLRPWTGAPLAFFGHSMGALIAFEVARRTRPGMLFASGRRAPSTHRDERVHLLDDDGLVAEATLLGGTDRRVLADPEMRELVLPVLRADYRLLETHRPDPGAVIDVPIEVLYGDRDPKVTAEEARAWDAHTSRDCEVHVFPGGGHFYLADALDQVSELVVRRWALTAAAPDADRR
ncbi:thioesterase II family protein [Streptomyces sp. NPDC003362]